MRIRRGWFVRVDCLPDGDAMVDEPSPNDALHFIDAAVERFTILDEGTEFAMAFGRHMNRFELTHGCHASELESMVFVYFAFYVGPRVASRATGQASSLVEQTSVLWPRLIARSFIQPEGPHASMTT